MACVPFLFSHWPFEALSMPAIATQCKLKSVTLVHPAEATGENEMVYQRKLLQGECCCR